jgi:DNA-binding MarR family transcriptional regulator
MTDADQEVGSQTKSRLQDELRQARPFHSKGQEAFLALLRTADVARRRFTELFERQDVTLQQYNVLRILRGAGGDGLPTLEIGQRMIERTPGVTRIVDRLEAKGLVDRDRRRDDRRRVWCRITDSGLALLAELDAPVAQADEMTVRGLGEEEVDQLIDLLERIRSSADDDSD